MILYKKVLTPILDMISPAEMVGVYLVMFCNVFLSVVLTLWQVLTKSLPFYHLLVLMMELNCLNIVENAICPYYVAIIEDLSSKYNAWVAFHAV